MRAIIFIILILSASVSFADRYRAVETISRLGTILSREDADYIILNGFTSAGSCPLSGGLVAARFPSGDQGSRAYSLALVAKTSGKAIELVVDDSVKNSNGSCLVRSLELKG